MLEIRGLEVTYGTVEAVRGIDISVGAGEAIGFLGPNGAGKTSTLRAISQLTPYRGQIEFDGTDLRRSTAESVARAGLIHVPEGRHLFASLSVRENLQMGEVARGGRTSDYGMDDVLDLFPALPKLIRRPGWALSGGEQQMVAIGRGLLAAPRLLLLDEPSLGLAPAVTHEVFAALKLVKERTPMLVVEQNTGAVLDLCSRAYVLVDGRVVLNESRSALTDRRMLLDSFLGRADVAAAT